jgi:peroxiredoxin family protein
VSTPTTALAVFLHAADDDRLHQGLAIAAAAAALDRRVDVFLFWWALERLAQGDLDEPRFPGREDIEDRFEAVGAPSIGALLLHLRASPRVQLYACTASAALVGLRPEQLERLRAQPVGWPRILQLTAGVTDRFYL